MYVEYQDYENKEAENEDNVVDNIQPLSSKEVQIQ